MNQAEILAVGDGEFDADGEWQTTDPALKPGLWVLHDPWARTPTWDDDLFILREEHVLAVLEIGP